VHQGVSQLGHLFSKVCVFVDEVSECEERVREEHAVHRSSEAHGKVVRVHALLQAKYELAISIVAV